MLHRTIARWTIIAVAAALLVLATIVLIYALQARRQADLQRPGTEDRQLVALVAAWLGQTRLIDNVEFDLKS